MNLAKSDDRWDLLKTCFPQISKNYESVSVLASKVQTTDIRSRRQHKRDRRGVSTVQAEWPVANENQSAPSESRQADGLITSHLFLNPHSAAMWHGSLVSSRGQENCHQRIGQEKQWPVPACWLVIPYKCDSWLLMTGLARLAGDTRPSLVRSHQPSTRAHASRRDTYFLFFKFDDGCWYTTR